jgi:hypothetical protein
MNYLRLFREFVEQDSSQNYVKAKMEELQDLISNINNDSSSELMYNWNDNKGEYLVINFDVDGRPYRYELDLKYDTPYDVKKYVDNELLFQDEVDGEEEGLEVIEKDIMNLVNEIGGDVSESLMIFLEKKRGRPRAQRYKGRKIPGKYLTANPGKMKKEIDTFVGKNVYKKDWDADYKSGKGGEGKRVKTKKSAATKAYQKMFGDKEK